MCAHAFVYVCMRIHMTYVCVFAETLGEQETNKILLVSSKFVFSAYAIYYF